MAYQIPARKMPQKDTMYPSAGMGNVGSSTTGRELRRHHKPFLCEFLQMALCNNGRGPVLLCHGLRRKDKQHSLNPDISPISFFLSFFPFRPSFFFTRREGDKEGMTGCVRECRGVRGQPPATTAREVTTEEVKRLGPHKTH
jgi:hypothetical protein